MNEEIDRLKKLHLDYLILQLSQPYVMPEIAAQKYNKDTDLLRSKKLQYESDIQDVPVDNRSVQELYERVLGLQSEISAKEIKLTNLKLLPPDMLMARVKVAEIEREVEIKARERLRKISSQ